MAGALPSLKHISECADFSKTVAPYLPQLQSFSSQVLQSWSDLDRLKELYISTNPLITALTFALSISPVFLLVSEITQNYSQVDRAWSFLPTIYIAHFTAYAHLVGLPTQRLDTLLAVGVIWTARLTFNYFRKGGYNWSSEDYRWEIVRSYAGQPLSVIFNVIFISFVQNILLLSIAAPTYILLLASKFTGNESTMTDLIFSRGMAGLVLVEWFADQQQWNFQQAKRLYLKTARVPAGFQADDLDRGFVVTGLWSWSRHPNFAAEQVIWTALYQWSNQVIQTYFNWTGLGALALILLFQASTWLTELISARKYPEYVEYQHRVGRFLPRLSTDLPRDVHHPPSISPPTSSSEKKPD